MHFPNVKHIIKSLVNKTFNATSYKKIMKNLAEEFSSRFVD